MPFNLPISELRDFLESLMVEIYPYAPKEEFGIVLRALHDRIKELREADDQKKIDELLADVANSEMPLRWLRKKYGLNYTIVTGDKVENSWCNV